MMMMMVLGKGTFFLAMQFVHCFQIPPFRFFFRFFFRYLEIRDEHVSVDR